MDGDRKAVRLGAGIEVVLERTPCGGFASVAWTGRPSALTLTVVFPNFLSEEEAEAFWVAIRDDLERTVRAQASVCRTCEKRDRCSVKA